MRAFLSLTPDAETAMTISQWSALCWPMIERLVPVQNYHITIAFLGEIDGAVQQSIVEDIENRNLGGAFALALNRVGYWPDARVLWLGSDKACEAANKLAQTCKQIANRSGVRVSGKKFEPHITLARKPVVAPPAALIDPDFTVQFESLQLYQSILDRSGARYVEVESFRL